VLKLVRAEKGKVGILRMYQHDRLGILEVVTVRPNAGAEIIHLQTFKIRGAPHDGNRRQSNAHGNIARACEKRVGR
jgi:hypothetical protein